MELHTEVHRSLLKSSGRVADARRRATGLRCPQPDRRCAHRRRASRTTAATHRREGRSRRSEAFATWRSVPAPRRGELVRRFGELVRAHKEPLGRLVSIETGKILQEGLGEVQEVIDICDFAVGLSRQLHGLTIASERPGHRMMETWHPLGTGGGDQRLQLPGRGVGLERGAGAGVRRHGDVEAVGEDAADRARHAGAAGACLQTQWAMCPRTSISW